MPIFFFQDCNYDNNSLGARNQTVLQVPNERQDHFVNLILTIRVVAEFLVLQSSNIVL